MSQDIAYKIITNNQNMNPHQVEKTANMVQEQKS